MYCTNHVHIGIGRNSCHILLYILCHRPKTLFKIHATLVISACEHTQQYARSNPLPGCCESVHFGLIICLDTTTTTNF